MVYYICKINAYDKTLKFRKEKVGISIKIMYHININGIINRNYCKQFCIQ